MMSDDFVANLWPSVQVKFVQLVYIW